MAALQAKPDDAALIDDAAVAVWEWMIVRESLAFFDHAAAMATYGIPPHPKGTCSPGGSLARVLARVGAVTSRPSGA